MPVSQTSIDLVKATAPLVKEHGEAITARMYAIAFEERPDYRLGFTTTWMVDALGNGQARKLAAAVYAYATHIDRLDDLAAAVDQIAHRHVACRILPEQYPLIGEKLIQAMGEVLGDGATEAVLSAWSEAYTALADLFIAAEARLYRHNDQLLKARLSDGSL